MLILFDIDATLIRTSGTGIRAMGQAGRALYGPHFDERRVEFAGRLDPLIIADLLRAHAIEPNHQELARFRTGYRECLIPLLKEPGKALACPGVLQLLARLHEHPHITLGLLTGNFPETGRIKLSACGVDPDQFSICVWGDESPHTPPARTDLPPLAIARYGDRLGRSVPPGKVTIIGDTPHDIECARANACRSLGVGTGQFTPQQLREHGADHVVADLSDTEAVLSWIVNGERPSTDA